MIDPWKDFTFLFRIAKHQLNAVSISFASLRSVSYNVSLVDAADVAICDAEPCGVGGFPTTTPLKPGLTSEFANGFVGKKGTPNFKGSRFTVLNPNYQIVSLFDMDPIRLSP